MCSEYGPDRHVRDEQELAQAREDIRRLFERYRVGSLGDAAGEHDAGVEAPNALGEQEPLVASH
jgi:hypothetical protein